MLRLDNKYLDMLCDRINGKNTEHIEMQIWIYPTLSAPHVDLWMRALVHPIPCNTCHSYLICFHHLWESKCCSAVLSGLAEQL